MKKALIILTLFAALTACTKSTDGGSARLKSDTDSIAYIIGMNVGLNLIQMDSTMNVSALCEGIRDAFRDRTRLTIEEAEGYYLAYMNYTLPEKARAFEQQFLADIAASNRSYARTKSGVTYTIEQVGKQDRIPSTNRDSLHFSLRIRSTDKRELYSSAAAGDTLRMELQDLAAGLQEGLRLIGEGGKIIAWLPSATAFGAEGYAEWGIGPNQVACFEVELIKLDKYTEWNRRRNTR
ncbi:MAG: FKBP-type peptidyl-prolyl cis-trans isomerase [Alistipes sp.]|nr:FKBP-type peptidyl-prolyl cis-trans isomerase [Alistipes sp.]